MIEISRDTACVLYLFIALAVILFQWYKSNKQMKEKRAIFYALAPRQCEFCGHSFVDKSEMGLTRCPQCNCLNKQLK